MLSFYLCIIYYICVSLSKKFNVSNYLTLKIIQIIQSILIPLNHLLSNVLFTSVYHLSNNFNLCNYLTFWKTIQIVQSILIPLNHLLSNVCNLYMYNLLTYNLSMCNLCMYNLLPVCQSLLKILSLDNFSPKKKYLN